MPEITRREAMNRLAVASVLALGLPDWAMPALAQEETLVPFTDMPDEFSTGRGNIRMLDIRTIDGMYTPADKFFAIQHYNVPELDETSFRLTIGGEVENARELTMADIRARPRVELPAGYECSGNSPRAMQALASNGLWAGVSLKDLLNDVGLTDRGNEVVFFGADREVEEISSRGRTWELENVFGRSLSRADALGGVDALLAYELNGAPLTTEQGFPLRLVVPGWYGVSNVKWLERIHVQQARYMGKFMAREYVTIRGEEIGGEVYYNETSVTRIRLKSVIARVTRSGDSHTVLGFVLNDGTPLRSVEVKVDDGPWQAATMHPENTQYSWKLFTYDWRGAAPGEHTLVSRATDVTGHVQPAEADPLKKTSWENDQQFPRTVMIA